jgi:hypothetical protein
MQAFNQTMFICAAMRKGFFSRCTGCTGLFGNTRAGTTSDVEAMCKLFASTSLRLLNLSRFLARLILEMLGAATSNCRRKFRSQTSDNMDR